MSTNYTIEQVVGSWAGAGGNVTITPKVPGSLLLLFGIGTGTATGTYASTNGNAFRNLLVPTQIGGATAHIQVDAVQNLNAGADTITFSVVGQRGFVAVEISGATLLSGAALAALVGQQASSSGSGPWTMTSPATGTISSVPAACIGFAYDTTSSNLAAVAGGYSGDAIAWQTTAPAAGTVLLGDSELTASGAVTFSVSNNTHYDTTGFAVVVLPESILFAGAPADASSATGALTTGVHLAGAADAATTAAGVMGLYLYGNAQATASASASLTAAIQLALAAADASSASGALLNWSSVALAATLYTGPGSIVDAVNEQWSDGAPAAGDTVYYDGTYMDVLSNGEIVATNNSFTALCQWLPSPGVTSLENVVMMSGLTAYARAQSASTAVMTTAIVLLANAQALANATGSLIAQTELSVAMADVASAAAALATAIELQAAASDDSTATAALTGASNPLAGAASDTSSAGANLITVIQMLGAAAALVQATADLTTQVRFDSAVFTNTAALGSLSTADFADVTATVQSQASGAMTTAVRLAGPAVAVATAAAQLATQVQLVANAASASAASATLVENPLAGAAADASSAGAALSTHDLIDAAVATIASATGGLTTFINMSAAAASYASGRGALTTYQPLLGSAEDDSAAAASLTAPGSPYGLYAENPWWVVSGIRQDSTSRFPIITPTETEVLSFDFSDELLVGEELQGRITVSVACTAGENANPSAVLLGVPSYDTAQRVVEFPVGNCPDGEDFYFTVTAPTTTPYKVLTRFGLLQSRA